MKTFRWKTIGLAAIALMLIALPAAAQYPVRIVSHYPASGPAEIHFVDGSVGICPISGSVRI